MFLKASSRIINFFKIKKNFSVFTNQDFSRWSQVEAQFNTASSLLKSGDLTRALSHFDLALSESSEITPKNIEFECMWLSNIAYELFTTSNDKVLEPYLQKALALISSENSSIYIQRLETLLKLGRICAGLNMLDEAETVLNKCLTLRESLKDELKLEIFLLLVPIKIQKNLINEAKEISEEGIKICENDEKYEVFLSGLFYNYANCFYKNEEFPQAIEYYMKAVEVLEVSQNNAGKNLNLESFVFIVELMIKHKQESEAIEYVVNVINKSNSDLKDKGNLCITVFELFVWDQRLLPLVKVMIKLADSDPRGNYFLYKLAADYFLDQDDVLSSQKYAESLYNIVKTLGDKVQLLGTYFLLSITYLANDPKKSKLYLDQALELISNNPSIEGKKPIYEVLTKYYIQENDLENIEKYLKLCISETPQVEKDIDDRLNLYNDLSGALFQQGKIKESVEWQLKGLKECKKFITGQDERIFDIFGKIAVGYIEMNEYNKALEMLNESLEYTNKYFSGDKSKLVTLYSVYMNTYFKMNEFDVALEHGQKAEGFVRDLKSEPVFDFGALYWQLGILYETKSNEKQAIECFKQAKEIFKILGEDELVGSLEKRLTSYN